VTARFVSAIHLLETPLVHRAFRSREAALVRIIGISGQYVARERSRDLGYGFEL
jgi:hypothetical protein